ncbi:ABC transporter transmembrane domain-containing protein, partial [Escherichia coli]|uniref:ABC transporter transmembrane domain-containing protein n=1 Tax=Escherichia coli TaxID=562 RepID=UPI0021E20F6B
HGPEDAFIAVMTIIGAFILMYGINPELAIIAICMVPLLVVLVTFCNIKMNAAWQNMYGKIAVVNARVEDSVSGARVVKSFT